MLLHGQQEESEVEMMGVVLEARTSTGCADLSQETDKATGDEAAAQSEPVARTSTGSTTSTASESTLERVKSEVHMHSCNH